MKKLISIVVGLSMLMSPAFAWDLNKMRKQIAETNYLIENNHSRGSGTLIQVKDGVGLILTAAHIFFNQETHEYSVDTHGTVSHPVYKMGRYFDDPNVQPLQLVALDKKRDLAVLKIENLPKDVKPAKISCALPQQGDKEYAVGNPLGTLINSVTEGIVSSLDRSSGSVGLPVQQDTDLIQITSGIAPGSSGGAIYNDKGELIGVADAISKEFSFLNYAVSVSAVWELLKGHIDYGCP